jgi:hypothetical protein
MIIFLIIVCIVGIGKTISVIQNAPEGFEDADGFHFI